MSAVACVQLGVDATELQQLLERGSENAAQMECCCVNANIATVWTWFNEFGANVALHVNFIRLRQCSSQMSRLLAMPEYQGSWHFCSKIHRTGTC